jgi:hypothetical protein
LARGESNLGFGGVLDFSGNEEPARIVLSQTLAPEPASPRPASTAPRHFAQSQAHVATPSISLDYHDLFTRPDSDKPISCRDETKPFGRIRFICS